MNTKVIGIPEHIWEQDQDHWRAWMRARKVSSLSIIASYKGHIAHFYTQIDKPIREISESDVDGYQEAIKHLGWSEKTQQNRMYTVRSYWSSVHKPAA